MRRAPMRRRTLRRRAMVRTRTARLRTSRTRPTQCRQARGVAHLAATHPRAYQTPPGMAPHRTADEEKPMSNAPYGNREGGYARTDVDNDVHDAVDQATATNDTATNDAANNDA